ncbi:uncharacterized protein BDZ99DRAFT_402248 [Mytilinidion resinicola]|uniref:7alpha-cephem-methoxylase P8 chain related protein n=1 Tax=Mytilinidion resinicola TaxID=574789 RepID=A0A6A6Y290_9PEZI|nr:uncharacterized protein BDZ99DRAFT_402248 [Mytilinidion resinicola]KAF2802124.1 hypothetical protein BDZ99DRAFT_402248 [Mytilinidion resinicola]
MASAAVSSTTGHGPAFTSAPTPILTSSTKSNNTPKHVQTTLHYYKDPGDGSAPAPSYVGRIETFERPSEDLDVTITDVRGSEDKYTLDGNGFQIYPHVSAEKDFVDDDKLKAEYYPETEQLLKDATGASRVFIFDHTIRRPPPPGAPANALRGPVNRVHIDQSYTAAASRVPYHLPDEAAELAQKRFQIINVWRPIKTIHRDPLAVADAHSVEEKDLVGAALIYPTRNGETFAVKPNPGHRWYYKSELGPQEVILIKCFDSWGEKGGEKEGIARRVPHTAFEIPGQEGEGRESIEVRALVFY